MCGVNGQYLTWTDVVHEVVGRYGLAVKEDTIDDVAHDELGAGSHDGVPLQQEEHGGKSHSETGYTW